MTSPAPILLHPTPLRSSASSFLTASYPHPPVSFLRTPSPTPSLSPEVSKRMELPPVIRAKRTVTRLPGVVEMLEGGGEMFGFQARKRMLTYEATPTEVKEDADEEMQTCETVKEAEERRTPPPAYTAEKKVVSGPKRGSINRSRPLPLTLQPLTISNAPSRRSVQNPIILLPSSPSASAPQFAQRPHQPHPRASRPSSRAINSPRQVIFLARWDPANPGKKQHAAVLVRPSVAKGWRKMRGLPSPGMGGCWQEGPAGGGVGGKRMGMQMQQQQVQLQLKGRRVALGH